MAFIDTIHPADAEGDVREMYARQQAHYGFVPSYAQVFCHRPEVMQRWADLQVSIKRRMNDKRRFELVTFAAAQELKSTLCSVAHGRALLEFFSEEDVAAIARREVPASLSDAEAAMMTFARLVARDASAVKAEDVAALKALGFDDGDVFDIVATAAARSFWTKVIESLGAQTDAALKTLDPDLRTAFTAGRPISFAEPEALPEVETDAA